MTTENLGTVATTIEKGIRRLAIAIGLSGGLIGLGLALSVSTQDTTLCL